MSSDLSTRLASAKARLESRLDLETRLSQRQRALEQARATLAELERELARAEREARRLGAYSLPGLVHRVLGDRQELLDRGRREAHGFKLKSIQAARKVASLEAEAADLQDRLVGTGTAAAEYEALLARKEAQIIQAAGRAAWELTELTGSLDRAQGEIQAVGAAIAAGQTAREGLSRAMEAIRSASAWGTLDLVGGGVLADMAKHGRLEDAREVIRWARPQLLRFSQELAEVGLEGPDVLGEISSFDTFVDFFFDGLLADWMVQSKIGRALDQAQRLLDRIEHLLPVLEEKKQAAHKRVGRLQEDRRRLIETAE